MYTKEDIRDLASKNVVEVTFTKVDGTVRVMRCSLQEKYLPPLMNDSETTSKDNPNVLAVFDIVSAGWRSFRIDNVSNVEVVND